MEIRLTPKARNNLIRIITTYTLLAILVVFSVVPMLWMISTSIKPRTQIFRNPPQWIPAEATLEHYERVLLPTTPTGQQFVRYFANSTLVSVASALLSVVVAAPAAYAFSRFAFPGKDTAYFAVLIRNMFPLVVFLIPLFFLMTNLRLRNTLFGLIVAYLTFGLPLSIWLLRGFFDGIPQELERAARIDGCTRFGAFIRIILPLTTPGLAATAIYSFTLAWNEYPFAQQLIDSSSLRTLPVGLTFFFTENTSDFPGLMATAVAISVPVVIIFLILQRFFVSALTQGAVKQ
jgi:multiple sugar transport system permease protein